MVAMQKYPRIKAVITPYYCPCGIYCTNRSKCARCYRTRPNKGQRARKL